MFDGYTPGLWLIFSAVIVSGLCWFVNRDLGKGIFWTGGMLLIFQAWLQFINFDGSWPANQPPVEYYHMSKVRSDRLDDLIHSDLSNSDWIDYRRCKFHNVCVRKFESIAEPRSKN